MRYKTFGNSGLKVSELCLGTITFSEGWRFEASEQECARMNFHRSFIRGSFVKTLLNRKTGDLIDSPGRRNKALWPRKMSIPQKDEEK